jgi:hypothetical protein
VAEILYRVHGSAAVATACRDCGGWVSKLKFKVESTVVLAPGGDGVRVVLEWSGDRGRSDEIVKRWDSRARDMLWYR